MTELYQEEISSGPTLSFVAVPCHVQDEIDKTVKQVEKIEINTKSAREALKNMIVRENKNKNNSRCNVI